MILCWPRPALDSADRQEPSEALAMRATRLEEKIEKLKEEMERLEALEARRQAAPDQQISRCSGFTTICRSCQEEF